MVKMMNLKFKSTKCGVTGVCLLLMLSCFILPTSAFSQQPQAPAGTPLYSVNAKYVNGVAPGYWATAGSGLELNVSAGTAYCGNPPALVSSSGGTLTMTASATNYVYLDPANNCSPAVNTSGFAAGQIPIAKVVTGTSSITLVTDARTWFAPQPCATSATGSLNCSALGTNQDIALTPSGNGASVITNLVDKGGQVFNVKAYGAKGDGTTDDSPAFQAAFDAAKAVKGIMFIPPPEAGACYLLKEPINMTANPSGDVNVTVEGTSGDYGGETSKDAICGDTGGNVFDVTGSNNIRFIGVSVTSQTGVTNPSLVGIFAARISNGAGAQYITVENCIFSMVLHTSGTSYSFGWYGYASEGDNFINDVFQADYPLVETQVNTFNITSTFQTIDTNTTGSNTDDHFTDMELESSGLGPGLYLDGSHNFTFTGHIWNYSQGSSYSSSLYQYAIYLTGGTETLFLTCRQEGYPGFAHINDTMYNSFLMGNDAPGDSPVTHGIEFTDASSQIRSDTFRITDELFSSTTNYFYDATTDSPTGVAVLDDVSFACGSETNCIDIPIGNYNPGGLTTYTSNVRYSSSDTNPYPSVVIGGKEINHTAGKGTGITLPTSSVAANTCDSGTTYDDSSVLPTSQILVNNNYWYGLQVFVSNVTTGSFVVHLCNPTASPITPGSATMYYRVIN